MTWTIVSSILLELGGIILVTEQLVAGYSLSCSLRCEYCNRCNVCTSPLFPLSLPPRTRARTKVDGMLMTGGTRESIIGDWLSKLRPNLYISALAIDGEMVHIMCQRFIHERNESGICFDNAAKHRDPESFEISTDGKGELDIVTPLADIIDDGEDG
mmetsp:Transcript_4387/g.6915  ORF Transcript_4387/g.6915 Transcript_4387/m.6915 type:complete len:157 (+) Transcript_4387:627-1097(+)